jgi:hypothetical protein
VKSLTDQDSSGAGPIARSVRAARPRSGLGAGTSQPALAASTRSKLKITAAASHLFEPVATTSVAARSGSASATRCRSLTRTSRPALGPPVDAWMKTCLTSSGLNGYSLRSRKSSLSPSAAKQASAEPVRTRRSLPVLASVGTVCMIGWALPLAASIKQKVKNCGPLAIMRRDTAASLRSRASSRTPSVTRVAWLPASSGGGSCNTSKRAVISKFPCTEETRARPMLGRCSGYPGGRRMRSPPGSNSRCSETFGPPRST